MTATDDAREVLAQDASALRVRQAHRLARTLLALTGEQAVEAGTVVLREASGGWWDDGVAEDVVRAVLDAALAAAEEPQGPAKLPNNSERICLPTCGDAGPGCEHHGHAQLPPAHEHLSNACHHEAHAECRPVWCGWCHTRCRCACHEPEVQP